MFVSNFTGTPDSPCHVATTLSSSVAAPASAQMKTGQKTSADLKALARRPGRALIFGLLPRIAPGLAKKTRAEGSLPARGIPAPAQMLKVQRRGRKVMPSH
jgi:hypothetical protein